MAQQIKNTFLKSKMNKDLDDRILPNGEYRDARNISVGRSEDDDVGALENIIGNDLDGLKLDGTSTNLSAGPISTGETFTSTNYISATNITASGNISASGDLFFNNIDGGTF